MCHPGEPRGTESMRKIHVSLLLMPDAIMSSVTGIYDVLTCFPLLASIEPDVPSSNPFEVELVGTSTSSPAGVEIRSHKDVSEVARTDIVIAPALMVPDGAWETGRYPDYVDWLKQVHSDGAMLTSACSGVLLLAETGLLAGMEATIHWAYVRTFRENFPDVALRQERVLVAAGDKEQFVMSGASASWHDLVLYLVARKVGPTAAQAIAKFLMLQWHTDGQTPYETFQPITDHGDAAILAVQDWIKDSFSTPNPVEEMGQLSGLPVRTFKRRFSKATGYSPVTYVQQVRIQEAKRRLEQTDTSIERIGQDVGYVDGASFRRTFKRLAGISPAAYRKKFSLPDFARTSVGG